MNNTAFRPIPLIDTHKKFVRSDAGEYEDDRPFITEYLNRFQTQFDARADYDAVRQFLRSNSGVETTFNNYRTQVERLLLWAWTKRGKSFLSFRRSDVEDFMDFCQKPDPSWISTSIKSRFVDVDGLFEPNPDWRPFHMRTDKSNAKSAVEDNREIPAPTFKMAGSSIRQVYAVINSLFTYCTADQVMASNPCVQIKRDKLKWDSKALKISKQKSLSKLQWEIVLETAELMAVESPPVGERTLFCIVMMFGCYLRVSDLVGNGEWKPTMGCFVREGEGWYYHVVGKGNVQDKIAVRPDCMHYLRRYREFRDLSGFPPPGDSEPLLRTLYGRPGLTARQIRDDVQPVFDRAVERMKGEGFPDYEISALRAATLHWFRHTGATFDAPKRSAKNLQADMRHKSLATTQNIYYNTLDDERTAEVANLSLRQ
jgi:integrase